jgi:hypothetical protein
MQKPKGGRFLMYTRIRAFGTESALSEGARLEAIARVVPCHLVAQVLQSCHCKQQRIRKLCLSLTVYLLIAMNLFAQERLALVLGRLLVTFRWLCTYEASQPAGDAAILYRRKQLGVAPMVELFHRICRPLGIEQTQGAFLCGLRLMAIDGKQINLYDNKELEKYFGRPATGRGQAAFPQARLVSLVEIGTHAYVDAGVWPLAMHEREAALRLLRSVVAGMLLLVDRGLYSQQMIARVCAKGAHVLFRVPAHVKPTFLKRLPDGSWWVTLTGDPQVYRLIVYTIWDHNNPGHKRTYRLLTTLLDPLAAPGQELALCYHERWEIEQVYDETENRLLGGSAPLRSRSVTGVIQEIYALLIAHYCVRAVMHDAALLKEIDVDTLSFTAAVVVIEETIPLFQITPPEAHPVLYERLLKDIAAQPVQQRPPRSYPRVVKRKMSNFPLKRAEHKGRRCLPYKQAIGLI